MRRINFNAGPSRLPLPVLEQLKEDVLDYRGKGMSVLEMSHRSPEVEEILHDAQDRLRRLLGLDEDWVILFATGGASMQFVNVPLNYLREGTTAAYVNTGVWSKKAIAEAKRLGPVHIAATSEPDGFFTLPDVDALDMPADACYLHITSNNTIYGTQFRAFPKVDVPVAADMSSDMLSKPLPMDRFDLIYAGAQKNLGPAGVTLVLARKRLLDQTREGLPPMQSYKVMAENDSLYNTPPVFQILAVREVLKWIEETGGLSHMEAQNDKKGDMLYGVIDNHADFYKSPVAKDARSLMNVPFRLPSEELEAKFVADAKEQGMVGLKGHRSVGGIRVSMYNALLPEDLLHLIDFMEQFARANG